LLAPSESVAQHRQTLRPCARAATVAPPTSISCLPGRRLPRPSARPPRR
jgi:hypothetical protein